MATTCLVVMGVAGSGKSTVARLLADRLDRPMAEADEFHPEANIAKMRSGTPLTDADREPWLRALRDWISEHDAAGQGTVVTCSALKRSYRDLLRGATARVRFVHLNGTREVIGDRMAARSGHFMPPSLLDSQFADLEPLGDDEDGVTVDVDASPEQIADRVCAGFDR
jgi:gluconokinase